ncbi:2Fe-2S iron-sulfur cluster-binding protein [Streptomyces sp. B93]|uniref:2Fe-2S iron-sulfur cluster-binding protein n=1 Tax=Streptomyces sp. B93 TaxID=2824875 RepID=UPI001B367839|nr:2Fe-2S iron-sulfur cluster-binding protein [Streptomyces sp. B93]MBQ1092621.1 (2Fe-2S)-binding protein [Streptomyces sp. B93]
MTDDQHGNDQHAGGAPQSGGRWDPLPQGEYDDGATAFVQLPEGGVDALLAAHAANPTDSPLAAPGHGYVPPQITVTPTPGGATDPAATGGWPVPGAPASGAGWPEAGADDGRPEAAPGHEGGARDRFTYEPGTTGQWNFEETGAPGSAPGAVAGPGAAASRQDVTGQWSIPVAGGDLPDESGEFTSSSLVEQWGSTPPATLPGGAPAPWARPEDTYGAPEQPEPGSPADAAETPVEPAPRAEEPFGEATAPQAADTAAEGPGNADGDTADGGEPESGTGSDAGPDADAAREGAPDDGPPPPPHDDHPLASYTLRVNGADRPVDGAWIGESLLYVLRERLGLAGAKDGCSQGECGACNVQVDGRLVASCLVPAVTAAGSEVRTVEGLAADGQPSDVQRALARCGAVQCGFCVPGMAMTLHDLLEGNPAPTELETRQALCGNLCRCSGYRGVLDAVREVVAEREAHAAGDDEPAEGHDGPDAGEPRIPHQAGPGAGGVNQAAFESSGSPGAPGPHDQQPYGHGQDGGQA